jgi:hypothetical protein
MSDNKCYTKPFISNKNDFKEKIKKKINTSSPQLANFVSSVLVKSQVNYFIEEHWILKALFLQNELLDLMKKKNRQKNAISENQF